MAMGTPVSTVQSVEQATAGVQDPMVFPMGQVGKRLLCDFPLTKKVSPRIFGSLPLRDPCLGWFP